MPGSHPPLPASPPRLLGPGAPGGADNIPDLAPQVAALFAFVTDGILVQDGERPAQPLLHHAFDQAWWLHAGGPRYCARNGIDPDAGPVPLVAYLVIPAIDIVAVELAGVRLRRGSGACGRPRPASRCRIGWRSMPARSGCIATPPSARNRCDWRGGSTGMRCRHGCAPCWTAPARGPAHPRERCGGADRTGGQNVEP